MEGNSYRGHLGWRALPRRMLSIVLGGLLVGALVALLYSASMASRDQASALDEQRRSFEVIALARQVDATTARAEATLGRYVLSLDQDTGRLFQEQWRSATGQLRRLRYATRRSGWQNDNVQQLQDAFAERGETLNEISLRTTYDQKLAALSQFHAAGSSEVLPRMTGLLDRIIVAEKARLRERSLAVSLAGDRTALVGRTSTVLGLVMLVCVLSAIWLVNIAFNGRRSANALADEEAERADRLEAAVAQRTAELQQANQALQKEAAERATAEDSLRQLHKMEAVGQLTGGIAHDFNNMLAVVVGGLELARRKLASSPADAARHMSNAMEGANRAAALTRRLLAFARSEPLLPTTVDPDALVRGMADLIDRTIGDQISVHIAGGSGGWRVHVDQHQMENAILNLCVNARDAMDGRGQLTIRTGQAALTEHQIGDCPAGDYAHVQVTDSGCGMRPEVLERVFEPFFTTKPIGKGTGLGLSQIFGFVRQCKGEIRIESELGAGTTVHIYLPRRAEVEGVAAIAQDAGHPLDVHQPPTRILVVEDDPRVLDQTMAALAELGHLPVACDHPAKAVKLLASYGDIGLIVSDVLMPEMTGPEMVQALPRPFSAIPVLFVTGYAGDAESSQFGNHEVLRKPYTLGALADAVGTALSGSPLPETAVAAE